MATVDNARIKTAFAWQYGSKLEKLGHLLAETSGPVVAISRKGPRLLELAARENLIPKAILERVTSERALALDLSSATGLGSLVVFDDICIFGSTFRRIADVATEVFGESRVRGALFAVGSQAREENIRLATHRVFGLPADHFCQFINSEIAAFNALDKPYDIDHPILYVDLLNEVTTAALEKVFLTAASASGGYPTFHRFARADHGIEERAAWTLLAAEKGNRTGKRRTVSLRKVRCYYNRARQRLAIVPIAPEQDTLEGLELRVASLPSIVQEPWRDFRSALLYSDKYST